MPTIPHFNRHGLQSVLFTGSSIIRSFLSWEEEQGYLHLCCRSDTGPPAQLIWGQQWQRVGEGGTSGPSWFPNTSQLLTPPRVMTLAACESSSYLVSATHFPVIPKNYCQYDTGHMSRKHKQWNKGQHLVKENEWSDLLEFFSPEWTILRASEVASNKIFMTEDTHWMWLEGQYWISSLFKLLSKTQNNGNVLSFTMLWRKCDSCDTWFIYLWVESATCSHRWKHVVNCIYWEQWLPLYYLT